MSTNKARSSCDARSCQKTAIGRNQNQQIQPEHFKMYRMCQFFPRFCGCHLQNRATSMSDNGKGSFLETWSEVATDYPERSQETRTSITAEEKLKKRFVKKHPGGKLMQVEWLLDACSKIVRARLTLPRKKSDHRGACQVVQFLSSHAAFPPSRNLSSLAFKWVHPSCSISAVQSKKCSMRTERSHATSCNI